MPKKTAAISAKSESLRSFEITVELAIAIAAVIIISTLAATSYLYPAKIQNLKSAMAPSGIFNPVSDELPLRTSDPEAEYLQNSRLISKEHNFGQFETKLIRVGFYNGQFRADIKVKNAGQEIDDFQVERAVIRKGEARYEYAGGDFNAKNFRPGESRAGYVLYSGVPQDISGEITVIIGNSLSYSTIFNTITSSPHIYIIDY